MLAWPQGAVAGKAVSCPLGFKRTILSMETAMFGFLKAANAGDGG